MAIKQLTSSDPLLKRDSIVSCLYSFPMQENAVLKTRDWISRVVIGLGLCPFAEKVFDAETIRYSVTHSEREEDLLELLGRELEHLASAPRSKVETTFLIFPSLLNDFLDFNDFTDLADKMIGDGGVRGVIQLVGFHPQYQFAGTLADAPENYTNRSPFPMFHLLREESISELSLSEEELLEIPKRNIEKLKRLGLPAILALNG